MQKNLVKHLAVLLVSSMMVFTVSCQTKTVAVETGSNSTVQADESGASNVDTSEIGEKTLDSTVTGNDGDSYIVLKEAIFFEFDKATLTPEAIEILTQNGTWLKNNVDVAVTIEGHCDERGTNGYNLALGDRRAESVKAFLTDLGVDRSRLTTISYGEERPFDRGKDETAWARNRRAHFLIK